MITVILEFVETHKIDIEGTVNSFISIKEFTVDSQKITTDSSTEFDNNSKTELALGGKAKVEGYLDSNNILRTTKVDLD